MTIKATWAFNGQTKIILGNWHRLWCLLFGPFYYLFKGMFLWAILSLITANGLWIGSPRSIARLSFVTSTKRAGFQMKLWTLQPMSKPTHAAPKSVFADSTEYGPIEKAQVFGFVSPPTA